MTETLKFAPKDIIFREEDTPNGAYIIESGSVEILKHAEHGEVQLAVLDAGDVFGEMALFEPKHARSATARALDNVTVQQISNDSFKQMIAACPEQMVMIIGCVLNRLRDTNQRLAAKERATVILDHGIDSLTISANSDALQGAFDTETVQAANLPFSIGGYPKDEDKPNNNSLDIASEGPPLIISQKHLTIERQEDGVYVVDRGSRFCTIVNGKPIGRGKVSEKAPLQLGENKVTMGDHTSPYKLLITCS